MAKFTLFGGTNPSRVADADAVVVIGLGRFGQSLALELMDTGAEVLGIDGDEEIVQGLNGMLTHVVQGDATKRRLCGSSRCMSSAEPWWPLAPTSRRAC